MKAEKIKLTGSFAYGTPTKESDIDFVVHADAELIDLLAQAADTTATGSSSENDVSCRFGKLNLVLFSDEERYNAGVEGTDELISRKPVDRETAKRVMKEKTGED